MDQKPAVTNPFKAHYTLMQQIVGKIVNDTFFGLCCLLCLVLARWVFPVNSFFRGCSLCLAIIFGISFYLMTIVRVARKNTAKATWKALWLGIVIILPVAGGLLYYYLRLLFEYLPSGTRARWMRVTQKAAPEPREVPFYESEGATASSNTEERVNFSPAGEGFSPAVEGISPF